MYFPARKNHISIMYRNSEKYFKAMGLYTWRIIYIVNKGKQGDKSILVLKKQPIYARIKYVNYRNKISIKFSAEILKMSYTHTRTCLLERKAKRRRRAANKRVYKRDREKLRPPIETAIIGVRRRALNRERRGRGKKNSARRARVYKKKSARERAREMIKWEWAGERERERAKKKKNAVY